MEENPPAVWIGTSAVEACPALAETRQALIGAPPEAIRGLRKPSLAVSGSREELAALRKIHPLVQRVAVVGDRLTGPDMQLASHLLTPSAGPQDIYAMQGWLGARPWGEEATLAAPIDLPPLSSSVHRLMAVLDDPECSRSQVLALMEEDPTLVARTLQVANSSYFGLPGRVSTVERAVTVLGLAMLKGVVLAGVMPDLFPDAAADHVRDVQSRGLLASQLIRRRYGAHAAIACTAAILMDIGQLILARVAPDYAEVLSGGPTWELPAREFARYGVSHAEIGAKLLKAWGLPGEIVGAVGLSHAGLPHPSQRMTTRGVVFVAAYSVEAEMSGDEAPTLPMGWDRQMGLDMKALQDDIAVLLMQWPAA